MEYFMYLPTLKLYSFKSSTAFLCLTVATIINISDTICFALHSAFHNIFFFFLPLDSLSAN